MLMFSFISRFSGLSVKNKSKLNKWWMSVVRLLRENCAASVICMKEEWLQRVWKLLVTLPTYWPHNMKSCSLENAMVLDVPLFKTVPRKSCFISTSVKLLNKKSFSLSWVCSIRTGIIEEKCMCVCVCVCVCFLLIVYIIICFFLCIIHMAAVTCICYLLIQLWYTDVESKCTGMCWCMCACVCDLFSLIFLNSYY